MLTESDLLMINQTRQQITQNRTTPVTVVYEIAQGVDEWTGEPVAESVEVPVMAVVTESAAEASDFEISQNITRDRSSIQVCISLDQLEGYEADRPSFIVYRGATYAAIAVDREGMGDTPNRLEIVARKVL